MRYMVVGLRCLVVVLGMTLMKQILSCQLELVTEKKYVLQFRLSNKRVCLTVSPV